MKYAALLLLIFLAQKAFAADLPLPDPHLTPGAVLTTDTAQICQPHYSKSVRHTSQQLKKEIYREYAVRYEKGGYEIDHLIPLGLGGADVKENLWPQSYHSLPWNAHVKDRLEWKLHRMLCAGQIKVEEAQQAFATNWIVSYQNIAQVRTNAPPMTRACA